MSRPLPYARMYTMRLLLVVALIALYGSVLLPGDESSRLALFAGRLHPALVHLPIGLLILGIGLFGWTRLGFGVRMAPAVPTILHIGAWAAVLTAWAGTLLEHSGGYAGSTLTWHRFSGLGVATLAVVLVFLDYGRIRQGVTEAFVAPTSRAYRSLLAVMTVFLVVAGHLGGTLTHGEGYLTEHLPEGLRSLFGGPDEVALLQAENPRDLTVYEALVRPALAARCTTCHGADQAKGQLRLHTPEDIRTGGENGEVIVPGQPAASELIRRIRLPGWHEDHMPPGGRPALGVAESQVLAWWIEGGASFELTLGGAEPSAAVRPVFEAYGLQDLPRGIHALDMAPVDTAQVGLARQTGLVVDPLADGSPWLMVRCREAASCLSAPQVQSLRPLAERIAWLDLGRTSISDSLLGTLPALPHLERLYLQSTGVSDGGIAAFAGLEYLEYVNLYDTAVGDLAVPVLGALPSLRQVYLWQSRVTVDGVERLRQARPDALISTGDTSPGDD